jgi:diaminohydroxyphosphoribosylaminopyrimidine deaminase / 5-amino-6-(5-phosphoribosylamino)uracil reductase
MQWSSQDRKFMRRCLFLAQKGEGRVSPNPLVGCVVVKSGRIAGEGHHERFGGPHAEANALRGTDASGATLYVSLEPCSHRFQGKKTPPCVPLIIRSGISRVVIAAKDQHRQVHGIAALRKTGIRVDAGLFAQVAERQNEAFFKFISTGKPFVLAKMAQTANGKIGIMGKGSVRISGKEFDAYAQTLRNRYDSILVGISTVLADDPRLTCRMQGGRNPARIILDSRLRIPLSARVLGNAGKDRVLVATGAAHDRKKAERLRNAGATVITCGKNKVDLKLLLRRLPALGIYSVLIEGGARTMRSAISSGLADKALVAVSPKKIGDEKAIDSPFTKNMLAGFEKRKMGRDTVYEGRLKP